MEIHFADAVAQTLTAVVFAENDTLSEINHNQQIAFDYTA